MSQCFQKSTAAETSKSVCMWEIAIQVRSFDRNCDISFKKPIRFFFVCEVSFIIEMRNYIAPGYVDTSVLH